MDPKKLSILWPPHTYHSMHASTIYSYTILKELRPCLKVRLSTGDCPLIDTCAHIDIHEHVCTHNIQRGGEQEGKGERERTRSVGPSETGGGHTECKCI